MLKPNGGDLAATLSNLRDRIEQDRKALRARLAQPARRKRRSKTGQRSKLREIFRQYEDIANN